MDILFSLWYYTQHRVSKSRGTEINFQKTLPALVIPGAEKVLMGAITLEGLDLIVNPVTQELIGAHGDDMEYIIY